MVSIILTELIVPGMRQRHSGAIVFVSSISGKMGEGSDHAYGTMKAALIAAGKTLAAALAKDGIRVNVVAPGGMDEPGSEWERLRVTDPARVAAVEKSIPMGRLGRPTEVADCIAFSCLGASELDRRALPSGRRWPVPSGCLNRIITTMLRCCRSRSSRASTDTVAM